MKRALLCALLALGLAGCLKAVGGGDQDGGSHPTGADSGSPAVGADVGNSAAGQDAASNPVGEDAASSPGGEDGGGLAGDGGSGPSGEDAGICTPQCDDKECGDNGCGGQCAGCAPGLSCDSAGSCIPSNDSCSGATPLALANGQAVVQGSTAKAKPTTEGSCSGISTPDVVYSLTLASAQSVRIEVTTSDANYTPAVFVRDVCDSTDPSNELGCATSAPAAEVDLVSAAAGTYYIWISGDLGTSGAFTLTVKTAAPITAPANDTCAGAVDLQLVQGTPKTVQGTTLAADDTTSGSCVGESAGDVVYTFTTTAATSFKAVLDTGGTWEGGIFLRKSACGDESTASELGCDERAGQSTIHIVNLPAGTYWLWVDGYLGATGDFSLQATLDDPIGPPANDSCTGATPLQFSNGKASVTDTLLTANSTTAGSCGGTDGPDVVYQLTTTAPQSLVATLTPLSTFYATLYVRKICDSSSAQDELGCSAPFSGPAQVTLANLPAGTYFLWVDGDLQTSGDYTLDVSLGTAIPPPANDDCATPAVLDLSSGPAHATGNIAAASNTTSGSCGGLNSGDVVYQITTGAPLSLSATVSTSDPLFQPVVYLRAVCDSDSATDELACQTAANPGESATFTVGSLPAGTYWLWVDGLYGTSGAFDLNVTTAAPLPTPANDLCVGVQEVLANQAIVATTAAATDNYGDGTFPTACDLGYAYTLGGLDVVYVFKPASSGTYVISVTPDASYDVAVWVTSGTCAGDGSGCIAVADANPAGVAEAISLNAVAGTSYFIVVDSMWAGTGGGFTLLVK